MYVIIITITLLIFLEIINYLPKINLHFLFKNKENKKIDSFTKYTSEVSFEKQFDSGKLYTNNDYNLFIIKNNETTLVKKDVIYEINEPFMLKYININEKNIIYYI
jgi:hypothetical protein